MRGGRLERCKKFFIFWLISGEDGGGGGGGGGGAAARRFVVINARKYCDRERVCVEGKWTKDE